MTSFFVPGIPVPKGSAKAFYNKKLGRTFVVQTNADRQKPWASLISLTAQEKGLKPDGGAWVLTLKFYLPQPKAHFKTNGKLKPGAPSFQTSKPDVDKLVRCVADALTSVAYFDDSQLIAIYAEKSYASEKGPGVWVDVTKAEP